MNPEHPAHGEVKVAVTIPRELFDFLMGVGEIDGTSFGDLNDNLPGRFWWRSLMRACERATPPATDVALLQHENECLLNQVKQKDYPCSPHCEGYLRELRLRNSAPTPPDQPQIGQFPDGAEKLRRLDDFMVEEIMADHSEQPWRADDFKGDNEHLICCIDALLDLEDAKCLVPSGLGGRGSHAYRLLCAARHRLSAPPIRDIERVEQAIAEVNGRFPDWSPTPAMRGYARAVARAAIAAMPKGDAGAKTYSDGINEGVTGIEKSLHSMLGTEWRPSNFQDPQAPTVMQLIDRLRDAIWEEAARIAEAKGDEWHKAWRAGHKTDSHLEGKSDGADEIAAALRDRSAK